MRRLTLLLSFVLTLIGLRSFGQASLFGTDSNIQARRGLIISFTGNFDLPMLDMSKRFGVDYRIGGALNYKLSNNWMFGFKTDFILGNLVKEDSLMINVKDKYSGKFNGKLVEVINSGGQRTGVPVYERGYLIGLSVGKILAWNIDRPDNGWLVQSSFGFMQHKINLFVKDGNVAQLAGDYKKGYDRLTNGGFFEQYFGYAHFAKNKLINVTLGLDAVLGFTHGRRDYLHDVMRTDNALRYDFLFGVRGAWMIPIFSRRSEDLTFE